MKGDLEHLGQINQPENLNLIEDDNLIQMPISEEQEEIVEKLKEKIQSGNLDDLAVLEQNEPVL